MYLRQSTHHQLIGGEGSSRSRDGTDNGGRESTEERFDATLPVNLLGTLQDVIGTLGWVGLVLDLFEK